MSYKIKSLLYFVGFIASAVLYYALEPDYNNNTHRESAEVIHLEADDLDIDNKVAKLENIQE